MSACVNSLYWLCHLDDAACPHSSSPLSGFMAPGPVNHNFLVRLQILARTEVVTLPQPQQDINVVVLEPLLSSCGFVWSRCLFRRQILSQIITVLLQTAATLLHSLYTLPSQTLQGPAAMKHPDGVILLTPGFELAMVHFC